MEQNLQVPEELVVNEVLELCIVAVLVDSVLGLLPKLVGDVVVREALAVNRRRLEEILDAELESAGLEVELAVAVGIAGVAGDANSVFLFRLLDALGHLHLVLSKGVAVGADQHFVVARLNAQLHPLYQVDRLVREVVHHLRAGTRVTPRMRGQTAAMALELLFVSAPVAFLEASLRRISVCKDSCYYFGLERRSWLLTSLDFKLFVDLVDFFEDVGHVCVCGPRRRVRVDKAAQDVGLGNHRPPCQSEHPEERLAVREHTEQAVLVEPPVEDVAVAGWVVQNVPEGIFKALQGLLEVLGHLGRIVHRDALVGLVVVPGGVVLASVAGQPLHDRVHSVSVSQSAALR